MAAGGICDIARKSTIALRWLRVARRMSVLVAPPMYRLIVSAALGGVYVERAFSLDVAAASHGGMPAAGAASIALKAKRKSAGRMLWY